MKPLLTERARRAVETVAIAKGLLLKCGESDQELLSRIGRLVILGNESNTKTPS